jgi:hypothetical protein
MGYSLSWIAVKNGSAERINSLLGLVPTGRYEEIPESEFDAIFLPQRWYLVVFNNQQIDDHILQKVSSSEEIVHCFVEEHVMFSSVEGWLNGEKIWSAVHDSEKGISHLEIIGKCPKSMIDIRQRLTAQATSSGSEQSEIDFIFDVPVELARELTGFCHDRDTPGIEGTAFQILKRRP